MGIPSINWFRGMQSKLTYLKNERKRAEDPWTRKRPEDVDEAESALWSRAKEVLGSEKKLERLKEAWKRTSEKKSRTEDTLYEEFLAVEPQKPSSNEEDIREAAKDFLSKRFPARTIRDEFGQWSLSARPDFVMVDEKEFENPLIAVEVKSDRDTFQRLYRQLVEYGRFASTIYVAMDRKHYKEWNGKFASRFGHVGVLLYDGEEGIEEARGAWPLDLSATNWLTMLWGCELRAMLAPFRGRSKIPGTLNGMRDMVQAVYTGLEIEAMARAVFLRRVATGESGVRALDEFDMPARQELFDAALAAIDRKKDRVERGDFFKGVEKLYRIC